MKKLLALILSIGMCFVCVGCGCEHEYQFDKYLSFSDACRKRYKCSKCDEYKFEDESHTYQSSYKEPTCTEKGGDYYTCTKCNYSYIDNEIEELGCDNITKSSTTEYTESSSCVRCGGGIYGLITLKAKRRSESYSNYYYFEGTIYNRHFQSFTYVKAKLLIYNESDMVIHTDWTYAVDSMPLNVGETTSFDLMVKKSYCYNMSYFRFEYYN